MEKKYFWMLVIILVSGCLHLAKAQEDQTLQSQIQHVTVFRDRAQITSIANTTVEAGTSQLTIEGLPQQIDKQSIQVRGKGNLVILAVKHQVNYTKPQTKSPEVIKMEDSLDIYTARLEKYTYTKDILNKEQQMLLSNQAIGGSQTGVTVEKLKQMADFFRARLTEINEKLMDNENNLKKTQVQVARLQNQLTEIKAKKSQPSSEIIVSVSTKSKTPIELEIDYIVANAGWTPVYDLRANEGRSKVGLHYKANVYQRTGVDWDNTKITLSTANPSQGGTQPILNPLYVSMYQPQPVYTTTNARDKASRKRQNAGQVAPEMEISEEAVVAPAPLAESVANYTQIADNGLSVSFDIALPYSIPSGGNPQLVDIQTYELPATYSYVAIPKIDSDAFLTALVTGWEKYNLLSGNANVYFGGTFVGESYLNAQVTKDTLRLSLGRDKNIVIKRERVTDYSSKKTIGTNVKETVAYRITVRNTKKEPIVLTLEDQVPVSQDSQIEVELLEAKNASFNKETGTLTWKMSLTPAQTQTIDSKYSVKYPKDKSTTTIY